MAVAKAAEAFRTISEASDELDVPQHVLRHWEEVFGQIRPMRRAGGRRYYRPVDIDVLRGVRALLYDARYTTKGVQKIFRDNGVKYVAEIGRLSAAGHPLNLKPTAGEDDDERSAANETAPEQIAASFVGEAPSAAMRERLETLLMRLERAQSALDDAIIAIETIDIED